MADTFTTLLRLVLQETGGNQNVWGDINNASAIALLEKAIAARLDLDVTPATDPVTLTAANGADDQARNAIIALTGAPGGTRSIIVPSTSKLYIVSNETADNMTIKTVANAGVIVRPATRAALVVDPVADDVFSIGDVPLATETVAGIAEIATQAETDAGVLDDKIVTPLKLSLATSLPQATETVKGAAEIATQAETDAGVLDDKIISPLKLEGRQSTTLLTGLARRATQAEVDAGTEVSAFVTSETLANKPGTLATFRGAKAFGNVNQNHLNLSFNVVALNSEAFDTDTIHDNAVDNSRLTVPAGITKVRLKGHCTWVTNAVGFRQMRFRKNGAGGAIDANQAVLQPSSFESCAGNSVQWEIELDSGVIETVATDFFEMEVLQASGGALDILANRYWFEMILIA